jgi:hypothetical protein
MKKMPQLIQFHLPDFFPDFWLRQRLGCLAHPFVGADGGDIKQLPEPAKTGLAEAVEQDRQGLGRFRAAALGCSGKVKAASFAAVTLEPAYKAMLNKRGAATSLARKFHGITSWMVSGGILSHNVSYVNTLKNSWRYADRESFQRLDKFPVIADCVFVSLMLSKRGARRSVLNNLPKMGIA